MNKKTLLVLLFCQISVLSAMDSTTRWMLQRYNDKLCQRVPWREDAIKKGDCQFINTTNRVESYLECLQEASEKKFSIDYSFFPTGVAFDDLVDCITDHEGKRQLSYFLREQFLVSGHKPREWGREDGVEVPGNLFYAITGFNFKVAQLLKKYGAQVGERELQVAVGTGVKEFVEEFIPQDVKALEHRYPLLLHAAVLGVPSAFEAERSEEIWEKTSRTEVVKLLLSKGLLKDRRLFNDVVHRDQTPCELAQWRIRYSEQLLNSIGTDQAYGLKREIADLTAVIECLQES